jgi:hypothetical protein
MLDSLFTQLATIVVVSAKMAKHILAFSWHSSLRKITVIHRTHCGIFGLGAKL